jgi:uncharacterized protein
MLGLCVAACLVGLAGGVHCVAMCGGIVTALNLRRPAPRPLPEADPGAAPAGILGSLPRQLAYSAGRLTTYTLVGAVAGGLGSLGLLYEDILPVRILLLILANSVIVLLGLYLAGLGTGVLMFERAGRWLWHGLERAGARLAPADSVAGAFAVGLIWGWIPCGLVYSVLATALVSGSTLAGAMVMAAFGLGTLPNLLAAGLAADRLNIIVRRRRVRLAAGLAVALLGLAGLARIPGLKQRLVGHGSGAGAARSGVSDRASRG